MKTKRALVLGLSLIASCLFLGVRRGLSQPPEDRIVRIAELEIYPDQLDAYKASLKEEISASIRKEPGVLTLYAVSVRSPRTDSTFRNLSQCRFLSSASAVSSLQAIQRADAANGEVTRSTRDRPYSSWLKVQVDFKGRFSNRLLYKSFGQMR
jgi:hypothetical protein